MFKVGSAIDVIVLPDTGRKQFGSETIQSVKTHGGDSSKNA